MTNPDTLSDAELEEWVKSHTEAFRILNSQLDDFTGDDRQILQDCMGLNSRILKLIDALRKSRGEVSHLREALDKISKAEVSVSFSFSGDANSIETVQKLEREGSFSIGAIAKSEFQEIAKAALGKPSEKDEGKKEDGTDLAKE